MGDGALKWLLLGRTAVGTTSVGPTFSTTEGGLPALSAGPACGNTPRQHRAGAAVGDRGSNRQVAGVSPGCCSWEFAPRQRYVSSSAATPTSISESGWNTRWTGSLMHPRQTTHDPSSHRQQLASWFRNVVNWLRSIVRAVFMNLVAMSSRFS